jgi:pimeloyl-ACP methyl ester carboxylesterase
VPRTDRIELSVDGIDYRLDVAAWGDASPTIVFAHEGLGSIGQWREVPERVAAEGRLGVLAYNRAGHGTSEPVPPGPWPPDWMSREAVVLGALLERWCDWPVRLVGHSDGATIALLCAAERPDLVTDIVCLAAHSWVEPKCVEAIRALRTDPDELLSRLARHHAHPAELFAAWSGAWVGDEFAEWDIRPRLGAVAAPTLVVQGDGDEYATEAMADGTAAAIGRNAQAELIAGAGHMLHRDVPDRVVEWALHGIGAE